MHDQSPRPSADIDYLARVLITRELPTEIDDIDIDSDTDVDIDVDVDRPDELVIGVEPVLEIDLTIIDLTDPRTSEPLDLRDDVVDLRGDSNGADSRGGPAEPTRRRGGVWGLRDSTAIGRLVTPEHVLDARSRHRGIAAGMPLVRSVGTVFVTAATFANDYVYQHFVAGDGSPDTDREPNDGWATAKTKPVKDAEHRLAYFLELSDEDFAACFRFNGEITGEYLLQVERCERARVSGEAAESAPEPTAKQRRRRKAHTLRHV